LRFLTLHGPGIPRIAPSTPGTGGTEPAITWPKIYANPNIPLRERFLFRPGIKIAGECKDFLSFSGKFVKIL